MKKLIFLLLIVLVINDIDIILQAGNPRITKEEAKNKILSALRSAGSKVKYNYPSNYQKYVTDLTSTTIVKFDQILHTKIDSLKWTHNFPDKTINQFKAIKYSKNTISYETFEFSYDKARTKIGNVFGVATKLDDDYVYFAYVKGEANAKAIIQFNSIPYEDCTRFLFFKSCETKHRREKRGFKINELQIIENALKAKFYETLNSILDLDQQKMIERFKNFAQRKKTPYPLYRERYNPIFKTFLDFKTVNLYSIYSIDNLKKSGFDQNSINNIKKIFNKPNNYVEVYQTIKSDSNEHKLKMGVAYAVQGKIILSYVDGQCVTQNYKDYCLNGNKLFLLIFRNQFQTCADDPECVNSCDKYKKLVRDPIVPWNDIPNIKKNFLRALPEYLINLQKILLAEITNKVSNILNDIKF